MRKRKFPQDVARQSSYIPVYQGKGPAKATMDRKGNKIYEEYGK